MDNSNNVDNDLLLRLIQSDLMDVERAESFVMALEDIDQSITVIYSELLPKLKSCNINDLKAMADLILDIELEFHHIDYHIKDAKLHRPYSV